MINTEFLSLDWLLFVSSTLTGGCVNHINKLAAMRTRLRSCNIISGWKRSGTTCEMEIDNKASTKRFMEDISLLF
jgi:hypothetical protein